MPRVVGYVTERDRHADALDAEKLADALALRMTGPVLATKGPEGVAIVVDLPRSEPPVTAVRRVKQVLAEVFTELPFEVIAGLSAVSREPAGVPGAYREAVEVARCIESFAGAAAHRVLAADDLGPGRLFVANGDAAAIDRFVDDVVGPLLSGEDRTAGLLRTLQTFFETGRSVRQSAARLRVHENTIRYRLGRIHELTGLDVSSSSDDQLTAQTALLILRIEGRLQAPQTM